jgi:quercetin dioxygenase-like cupin family protein
VDVETAELLLPCDELLATLAFFTERLGFRLESIFPADDPREALLVGHGLRIRLQRGLQARPTTLRLRCRNLGPGSELTAPNGTQIELVNLGDLGEAKRPLELAPLVPKFVLSRLADAHWGEGRASMRYRDLIPDRQGGRFIASHIQIPTAGPVPDDVHYHAVRLQLIYCYRGWVRVVYEDQGPPFVLEAGDCVLQVPRIRHRVLESSAGLEVIELSCPGEHETFVDHELRLPTPSVDAERRFDGQRFVRHQAQLASWQPWRVAGFESREIPIAAASDGLAQAHVVRPSSQASPLEPLSFVHDGELSFGFVLEGGVTLTRPAHANERLAAGDTFVTPAGLDLELTDPCGDLQLLVVQIPAR